MRTTTICFEFSRVNVVERLWIMRVQSRRDVTIHISSQLIRLLCTGYDLTYAHNEISKISGTCTHIG